MSKKVELKGEFIDISVYLSADEIKRYGGTHNCKVLLGDIVDRYFNVNYFDYKMLDLIEEGEKL